MSAQKRVAVALSAMWLSRAVTIALNLILLPVMFRHLEKAELGTWMLLLQAGTVVQFMDFGLASVLNRRIAIASGSAPPANAATVPELLAAARLMFRIAAVVVFLLTLSLGWLLLPRLGLSPDTLSSARLAWLILCVGYGVNLASTMWAAAVGGLGHVAAAATLGAGLGVGTVIFQIVAVFLGAGLVGLSIAVLCGGLVQRWALWRLLRAREPDLVRDRQKARRGVAFDLLRPSLTYWVTEIGAVMLLRTDQFFIAGFQDTSKIPAYYAAYSLVFNMAGIATAVGEAACIFLARQWRDSEPRAAHALVLQNARIGLALMTSGVALVASIGNTIIDVWLGPGHFVGYPVLLVFCAMLTLYVQQSIMLNFSRATENERYAGCYVIAGVLNLAVTWLLARPLGLLGIALGTLIAQSLTTSWYVPRSALHRLHISWESYLGRVISPALGVFVLTYLSIRTVISMLGEATALERMVAGCTAGSFGLAVGFWFLILDRNMRMQVRSAIRVGAG